MKTSKPKRISAVEAYEVAVALRALGTTYATDMARFLSDDRRPALNANASRLAKFRAEYERMVAK
jgi:hypothetical protein